MILKGRNSRDLETSDVALANSMSFLSSIRKGSRCFPALKHGWMKTAAQFGGTTRVAAGAGSTILDTAGTLGDGEGLF